MTTALMILAVLVLFMFLAFFRASIWGWLLANIVVVAAVSMICSISGDALTTIVITLGLFVAVFGIPIVRQALISKFILNIFRKILPQVSQTEQEALDAGTVWWDGELFSGHPNWQKLLAYAKPKLSTEEQSFLDNETEQLCAMIDDWDVTHVRQDLSPETWQFIKDKGFFGMIIPKEYGGLQSWPLRKNGRALKIANRRTPWE